MTALAILGVVLGLLLALDLLAINVGVDSRPGIGDGQPKRHTPGWF